MAWSFYCSSAIVLEARALFQAAQIATNYPHGAMIFSDCLSIITAIRGPKHQ
ncbi:hypothetical protein LINPERHAP1_LOCUS22797 [Linum perenne]